MQNRILMYGTPIRSKVILHTPYIPHSTPSTFIWTPRTLIPTPHSLILIPHLYGTPIWSKVILTHYIPHPDTFHPYLDTLTSSRQSAPSHGYLSPEMAQVPRRSEARSDRSGFFESSGYFRLAQSSLNTQNNHMFRVRVSREVLRI
jgi:hypothetical protein